MHQFLHRLCIILQCWWLYLCSKHGWNIKGFSQFRLVGLVTVWQQEPRHKMDRCWHCFHIQSGGGSRPEVIMTSPWCTADPSGIRFGLDSRDTLPCLCSDSSPGGCLSACSWPMRSCLLSSGGTPDSGSSRPSCSPRTPSKSCRRTCGGGCRYTHTCTHTGYYSWNQILKLGVKNILSTSNKKNFRH